MRRIAAILAFSLALPTAPLAAPLKLSDAELDVVTAGISAMVGGDARALGSPALTNTDTRTKALGGRFASVAFGRGLASARGSDGALTGVDVSGEGGRVRTRTDTFSLGTRQGAVSHSWGSVLAIEINRDAMSAARAAPR
jgi:hypothetical protein